jgi:drug/metabolite transporter (DMT)-like permease
MRDLPTARRLGVVLLTVSALAFSTTGFFTRLIAASAWTILFWRGIFGAFFILLYLVWIHRRGTFRAMRTMGWPGVVVTVASAITMVAYMPALKLTTVANVTLIGATLPFFACLLAWVWLGEQPSTSAAVASLVAFAGVFVMVAGSKGTANHWGDLLALVANGAFAVELVVIRRHRNVPMIPAAGLAALLATAISLPFADPGGVSSRDLVYLMLFGFFQMVLGFTLFTIGSRLIPAVTSALIGALEAPLGPWWVWLAFGEVPAASTFLGGGLVLGAVAGHTLVEARPEAAHGPT